MEYFKDNQYFARILGYIQNPYGIIIKYYPLGSLKQWIKKKKIGSKHACILFAHDITSALACLHEKGIVHADVKPDNVLIDQSQNQRPFCVLTDFGISQIVTDQILKVKQFHVAEIKGMSLAYSAPERMNSIKTGLQICNRQIVMSWDVYALGIILFELVNGPINNHIKNFAGPQNKSQSQLPKYAQPNY